MGAITLALSLLKTGQKVLFCENIYGGTFRYAKQIMENMGIKYELRSDLESLESLSAGAAGVAKAGALAVISPVALVPIAGIGAGVMAVKKFTLNSKIKEQQYSCAVMKFYLDDLSKFLGL